MFTATYRSMDDVHTTLQVGSIKIPPDFNF